MEAFDKANAYGLENIAQVIAGISSEEQVYDLHIYYTQNISYDFNAEKRKGLELFLSFLK
jgi:chorismate dehydratase